MLLRLVFAIPGLILTAAIAWAWNKADLWEAILQVGQNPWGVVTFIDLYAGFLFTGVIISAIERWKPWTFVLMASSLGLGNIVYAGWAVWRGASELQRIANR
jgi:cytochrome b subunit of formate dehydrogenase